MKILRVAFLSILMLLISRPAFAKVDGNRLLAQCRSAERFMNNTQAVDHGEILNAGVCLGMTHGIIEAMTVFSKNSSELNACFPKGGIGVDRGVRIVIKYLEDHPEGLYQPDTALMMLAFLDTYPCR